MGILFYRKKEDVHPLTETSMTWAGKNNIWDVLLQSSNPHSFDITNDLITLIRHDRFQNLYLWVHMEWWADNTISWISRRLMDTIFIWGRKRSG